MSSTKHSSSTTAWGVFVDCMEKVARIDSSDDEASGDESSNKASTTNDNSDDPPSNSETSSPTNHKTAYTSSSYTESNKSKSETSSSSENSTTEVVYDYNGLLEYMHMVSLKGKIILDDIHTGPFTTNGAPCLETTDSANLNLFSSPFIFFDGRFVAKNMKENFQTLIDNLEAAYIENSKQCIQNVLLLGNLRGPGKKNHSAYMVSLVWFWKYHPKTFLNAVAPNIATNSCARDLLTLLAVVTYNRSYPVSRLWEGEQPDAAFGSGRSTIKDQEVLIWKKLLKKYDLKSKDVVESQEFDNTRTKKKNKSDNAVDSTTPTPVLERDVVHTGDISDTEISLVSPTLDTENVDTTEIDTKRDHGKRKRVKPQKKNVWKNLEFKEEYQEMKQKLHARDYDLGGINFNPSDYKQLVDFVVNFFVSGLENNDEMVAKWAPTQGASHDKAMQRAKPKDNKLLNGYEGGVQHKTLGLPDGWNGEIAQAIGFKLFGHLLKKDENDGIEGVIFSLTTAKTFVMSKYKKLLSGMRRPWVPESLEGSSATAKNTPALGKVSAQWRAYRSKQTQTTQAQKDALTEYYDKVASGEFKAITKGGLRPDVLIQQCCVEKPDFSNMVDDDENMIPGADLTKTERDAKLQDWLTDRKTAVLQYEALLLDMRNALRAKDGVDFVCVSDVSMSMSGVPMEVCVALSLGVANGVKEDSPYFNTVLTFDSTCEVVKLAALENKEIDRFDRIEAAVMEIKAAPWGSSTCLESVFERIAELEKNRVHPEGDSVNDIVLLIFSDMMWDSAMSGADNMLKGDVLEAICKRVGLAKVPKIVYWDVSSSGKMSYPASANTSGTVLVSGYSESMVKCVANGDFENVSPYAFSLSAFELLPYIITDEMLVD